MNEDNLYGITDKAITELENEIGAVIESDAQTSEEFINACFPDATPELKAKIAIFSGPYYELFLSEEHDEK